MYNYTGYGMNPYQQQLTQNRIAQMEQQYNYQHQFQHIRLVVHMKAHRCFHTMEQLAIMDVGAKAFI